MLASVCNQAVKFGARRSGAAATVQRANKAKLARNYATSMANESNPKVFFDIAIGDQDAGRITFEVRISLDFLLQCSTCCHLRTQRQITNYEIGVLRIEILPFNHLRTTAFLYWYVETNVCVLISPI